MVSMKKLLVTFLLTLFAGFPAGAVPVHGTQEIILRSDATYDGIRGEPNPFAIDLVARVVSPSGRTSQVRGFFDGDGEGGTVGRVFRVRVHADEAGSWRWTTVSDASGLNGLSGAFEVSGRLPGFFGRGPIVVSPSSPRFFRQREGGPVFLVGKFLDVAAPKPIQFSHTMFSEELDEGDRESMLRRHKELGLNKVNVYLANQGDYQAVSTTPWVGTADRNDKARFDLARWRVYDRWIERLRDEGMVANLWFFADDSGFGELPDADRRRLIRYGMARLSGYVNTMFTLALEWQEGWAREEVESHGRFLQEENPWARLISVHGTTGDFAFPNSPWVDYLQIQAGNDAAHQTVHAMGLANRVLAAKPLIQEEHGLGEENDANRRKAWAAFLSGAAGVGTGADLGHLAKFAARVPFERMEPAGRLVLAGAAYALHEKRKAYLFYLPEGGTLKANLKPAQGNLAVEWYDPRTGAVRRGPRITGGKIQTFQAPSAGDWVLYIHKQ
jgi:Domain of unknown function (DUF5060)/Protein of unknown function (DUF4038)/Putative collagen-binding domain of a collagenase